MSNNISLDFGCLWFVVDEVSPPDDDWNHRKGASKTGIIVYLITKQYRGVQIVQSTFLCKKSKILYLYFYSLYTRYLHVLNTSFFFRGVKFATYHLSSLFNIATNKDKSTTPNSAPPGAGASLSEMSEPALKRPKLDDVAGETKNKKQRATQNGTNGTCTYEFAIKNQENPRNLPVWQHFIM